MSAIMLEGAMVHYEALGRGRPIVFLHGWVGSWRYWISAMQVASTSFRAYALDLYGFGDSAHEPGRYTLSQQATLLDNFLMAVNCPLTPDSINVRLRNSSLAELADWLAVRTPDGTAALADAAKADPLAVSSSIGSLQADNLMGMIHASGTPCLLVSGQNDPAVSMPVMDPSSTFPTMVHHILLEESGHFPMLDDPLRFNRLMTDFMTLDSGASPKELQLKEEWRRRVR
jgi:pimeloyl-ACP methyl ester carboxylesterase